MVVKIAKFYRKAMTVLDLRHNGVVLTLAVTKLLLEWAGTCILQ